MIIEVTRPENTIEVVEKSHSLSIVEEISNVGVTEIVNNIEVTEEVTRLEVRIPGIQGPSGSGSGDTYTSPAFTYSGSTLSRIDYSGGSYKLFEYTSGVLTKIDFHLVSGAIKRRVFNYSGDQLESIQDSII